MILTWATIYLVGVIRMLFIAFSESVAWGLVVLFCPFGNVIYACKRWRKAKLAFVGNVLWATMLCTSLCTDPSFQAGFNRFAGRFSGTHAAAVAPDLDEQIQTEKEELQTLEVTFSRSGANLSKQYQALEAQRKKLKPGDAAAIAKYNEVAFAYQARNAQCKQLKQDINIEQKQLTVLLNARTRPRVRS
jgi:Skp family chaperone for outer membrane proteins